MHTSGIAARQQTSSKLDAALHKISQLASALHGTSQPDNFASIERIEQLAFMGCSFGTSCSNTMVLTPYKYTAAYPAAVAEKSKWLAQALQC